MIGVLAFFFESRLSRYAFFAEIYPLDKKNGLVTLKDHEESIAPGQACVFYEQNSSRVLGGGWISN